MTSLFYSSYLPYISSLKIKVEVELELEVELCPYLEKCVPRPSAQSVPCGGNAQA
jgi:hypothetical protein